MEKYTVKEYAEKFGLNPNDVLKDCRNGVLSAEKVSGKWVITVKEATEWHCEDCGDKCDCSCDTDEKCDCCCDTEEAVDEHCCDTDEKCDCCCDTEEAAPFNPLKDVTMNDILDEVASYIINEDLSKLDKFESSDDAVINIKAEDVTVAAQVFRRLVDKFVDIDDIKKKHVIKIMELFVDTYQPRVDTYRRFKNKVAKFITKANFDLIEPTESLKYFFYNFIFVANSVINKVVYDKFIISALEKEGTKDKDCYCDDMSEEMTESLSEE